MARLIDYGMRAGGIAERKRGVAGQKSEQTVYVWEGNVWGKVDIHTLDSSHRKKRKRENIEEKVKKKSQDR